MALSDEERNQVEPLTRFLFDRGREITGSALVATAAWLRQFEKHTIAHLRGFDAVITPGLATLPPAVGWYDDADPQKNFIQQIQVTPYTSFVNVCGLPALALPTHYTSEALPMGVQLVGPPGREDTLVALGHHIEQRVSATRWPAHSVGAG
jgi:amidase